MWWNPWGCDKLSHIREPSVPTQSSGHAENHEVRLALACARRTLTPAHQAEVRGSVGHVTDDRLLEFAARHGLTTLLYWHVDHCYPDLQAAWFQHLHRSFENAVRSNLNLTAELRRLQSRLADVGVRVLAYKGPALAHGLYGHIGLRDSEDLDLLVRRSDLERASECMVAAGYVPEYDLAGDALARYLAHSCERNFIDPASGVLVELHWQIVPPSLNIHFAEEDLWENAQSLEFNGVSCFVPAPEILLLALCVHGTKHMWQRLIWLVDVAELTHPDRPLDWERVLSLAAKMRIGRILRLAVLLAQTTLGGELPPQLRDEISQDTTLARLAASLRETSLHPSPRAPGAWERLWFDLRLRESWRERAGYMAARVQAAGERAPSVNRALRAAPLVRTTSGDGSPADPKIDAVSGSRL